VMKWAPVRAASIGKAPLTSGEVGDAISGLYTNFKGKLRILRAWSGQKCVSRSAEVARNVDLDQSSTPGKRKQAYRRLLG
jgi:hypothetical protein